MQASKSSAIDDILSKHDDNDDYHPEGRPGRKPGVAKAAPGKPALRNTQAWRAIEDMKESQRLKRGLKEVYDEDGAEEE
ncbi:MAG TPA: hypothetical protein VH327_08535 [Gammaproteobacteria bacterium]|jgi:hypothetical protein|nr:hypothetical protein [Gammaproteobacteria bacterium]